MYLVFDIATAIRSGLVPVARPVTSRADGDLHA
jgi:hypothetical protein